MSAFALLLAISAVVGAGVCLAVILSMAYDLRRVLRMVDRLQRQQRRHALVLSNLPEGLSFLAQCDLATTVALEQLRDIHRRIYGATDTTPYALPEEVDLGAH